MIWGANIHGSYTLPIPQLIALAKSIGLSSLRVDVYDASETTIGLLQPLVQQATAAGVSIVPVLVPGGITETAAHNFGSTIATAFPHMLGFECGNEMDETCILPGHDGTRTSDYDTTKYNLAKNAIHGLIAGIKAAVPAMSVGVGITGIHYGFLQRLWNSGVRWDVTTEHFYCPAGQPVPDPSALLASLAHFSRSIMFTEFNQQDGTLPSSDPAVLIGMMDALKTHATQYNILGGYIYELLDQPEQPPNEAHYGLADAAGNINAFGTAVKQYIGG